MRDKILVAEAQELLRVCKMANRIIGFALKGKGVESVKVLKALLLNLKNLLNKLDE